MSKLRSWCVVPAVLGALLLGPRCILAGVSLGDAGHYLNSDVPLYLNNPGGQAFEVTVYRFQWWIGAAWNVPNLSAKVIDPGGKTAFDQAFNVPDDGYVIRMPAGPKGVYEVKVNSRNSLNYWYATTTLSQAVAWTGPGKGDAMADHWFMCNPFVPRKWHFFVPEGTKRFKILAQNNRGRSQREDHGITLYSPRGQRFGVLWGQAVPDAEKVELDPESKHAHAYQKLDVVVEPGSDGRFWAVEFRMGDSHTYSDVNLHLEGVPPYLSPSPESWFDPKTGKRPEVTLYDEDEFVQSDRSKEAKEKHPLTHHWTPCPSLGDPDACEIRCPAKIALWNPEERELKFVIGTYLPRNMSPTKAQREKHGWRRLPVEEHDHATVRWVGPDGKPVLETKAPLFHLHGHERWERTVSPGRGVSMLDVTQAEHFWTYTYPGTPMVMVGQETAGGWHRFHFDAGHARNWYFLVPKGTKKFTVRAVAEHITDAMDLEINASDRTMARLFAQSGTQAVKVPEGLDGKIWHVRIDWGGASRPFGRLPKPRFPSINVTLDLKGVPGYLAPTWEQWFDPQKPRRPFER